MKTKEQIKEYHKNYAKANKHKFNELGRKYYAQKVSKHKAERQKSESLLHPLLQTKGHKIKKGTVKLCAYCKKEPRITNVKKKAIIHEYQNKAA